MPNRDEWLKQGFILSDHPFEPAKDPVHGLDFRMQNVSLSKPLDVFTMTALDHYFVRTGTFAATVKEISDFLEGQGGSIDAAIPPVLVIEGAGGTGRKTLGNFAAHMMKAHCASPPRLRRKQLNTDHFGRLLLEIKLTLEEHFVCSNVDVTTLRSRDGLIKGEDPDETLLANLFDSVAQQNLAIPMLILLIYELEYRNFDWIRKLHGMLRDLNVALIFLTKDNLVSELFKKALNRDDYAGCAVRLSLLTMQDGIDVLEKRLQIFRTQPAPAGIAGMTPYERGAIEWIFTGGTESRTIRYLLNMCRVSMNRKLAELVKSQPVVPAQPGTGVANITGHDVRNAFEQSLRQARWGEQK